MKVEAFEIDIPDADLQDLHDRLAAARWPGPALSPAWEDGSDLDFMQRLAARWRDGFDWRAHERRLNTLPHFMTSIGGQDIHFVHARGEGTAPMPLVLIHGWPGSFLEFEQILPMLTHPSLFGGDAADAFDVVIPSLPGFGFSPPPSRPGMSPRRIAGLCVELMRGLGYGRFGVQGATSAPECRSGPPDSFLTRSPRSISTIFPAATGRPCLPTRHACRGRKRRSSMRRQSGRRLRARTPISTPPGRRPWPMR